MLPERALELLTAYVDGELSSRQREQAVRLLHDSPEARQILSKLQEDSQRIRRLPQTKVDPAFAGQVVAAIIAQRGQFNPDRQPVGGRRRIPVWARFAVAASLLAVVGGGVLWLANRQPPQPERPLIVKSPSEPKSKVDHSSFAEQIAAGAARGFGKPVLPARPAAMVAFQDLAKQQFQEDFDQAVAKKKAVHVEIVVKDQRQAQQRLETVLQNKGVRVERDPRVEAIFKDPKSLPPTEFVLYTENIRPDELAAMLYELGTDERARTSIEGVTVSSVTDDDQNRLSSLLGIQPRELREPLPDLKVPLQKAIPADDTKSAGAGSGANRAPSAAAPRLAVVLANDASGGRVSSQVQYFLNQRRQLQPGALQVIVVVHRA